ncbi:type II toxin-antitoxin system Phd/YefM family antitoxin [Patescibacteria group bacterium]|nr:type II toxin-antitoxin system Phd/YefM family antitoxin [Patescibacteria group bacterium]
MSYTKEISARDAKNRFGELLDSAQRAPVRITKNGRGVAMLLSLDDYQRFEETEDALWAARAEAAHKKGGYLGTNKSEALLKKFIDAKD